MILLEKFICFITFLMFTYLILALLDPHFCSLKNWIKLFCGFLSVSGSITLNPNVTSVSPDLVRVLRYPNPAITAILVYFWPAKEQKRCFCLFSAIHYTVKLNFMFIKEYAAASLTPVLLSKSLKIHLEYLKVVTRRFSVTLIIELEKEKMDGDSD